MNEEPNEKPNPGWGLVATLKIIAAVVVMIVAGSGILLVLDIITLETFKVVSLKTALVGGVSALAGVVLGLLSGWRR